MLPNFEFMFFTQVLWNRSSLSGLKGQVCEWGCQLIEIWMTKRFLYMSFLPPVQRLNVTLFFHPPFPPCPIPNIRVTLHVDKCLFIPTSQYIFLVVRAYCLPSSFIHTAGGWNKGSCKYILDRSNGVPLPLPNIRDATSAKTSSWWAGHEEYIQPWCGW